MKRLLEWWASFCEACRGDGFFALVCLAILLFLIRFFQSLP